MALPLPLPLSTRLYATNEDEYIHEEAHAQTESERDSVRPTMPLMT
jgi:hypothetical protein